MNPTFLPPTSPVPASSAASGFAVEGETPRLKTHLIRLFWAFSTMVGLTFAVSVFNFATQTVLECPSGTELRGGPPPQAFEAYCVRPGSTEALRHGPYRRWHAMSSAYKGSKLAPDVLIQGQYRDGQKTGEWVTRTRSGAVIERWVEGAPKLAMTEPVWDVEVRLSARPPRRAVKKRMRMEPLVVVGSTSN